MSTENTPELRARGLVAVILAVAGALLAVAVGLALLTHHPVKLTANNLVHSVQDEAGSAALDNGTCTRRGVRTWTCDVADRAASGTATYAVEMTSDHCWKARLTKLWGEPPMPATASGCL